MTIELADRHESGYPARRLGDPRVRTTVIVKGVVADPIRRTHRPQLGIRQQSAIAAPPRPHVHARNGRSIGGGGTADRQRRRHERPYPSA
ncbi:hypothetical protein ACLQ3C_13450 [Gordonia sp. DT30]|uniref:hypothetical protein n=1 Tax=Gordonia sp. DT30 TaxID=3416546 RepID=UPI003CF16C0F